MMPAFSSGDIRRQPSTCRRSTSSDVSCATVLTSSLMKTTIPSPEHLFGRLARAWQGGFDPCRSGGHEERLCSAKGCGCAGVRLCGGAEMRSGVVAIPAPSAPPHRPHPRTPAPSPFTAKLSVRGWMENGCMKSLSAALILLGCTALFAQDVRPVFDAASIRAVERPVGAFLPGSRPTCPLNGCGGPGTGSPERITFTFISLKNLVRAAYDVWSPHHIEAPSWMDTVTFDVVANVPPGATRAQANLMLQNLLADRFQLKVHRSTRDLPVYALVVARNGPKLKVSVDDPNAPRPRGTMWSGGRKRYEFTRRTMADFAETLGSDVDRPVIDMTGLEGAYDIRLEFAETRPTLPAALGPVAPDPQAPELFTALTEQLGLRLESRRGPVEVLVVDSALRQPTEN